MKACKDCGEEKPLDDFHKNSQAKDGKRNYCKLCQSKRNKKWTEENPGRAKAWRDENQDKLKEWAANNREKLNKKHLDYYYANPDKIKEYNAAYRARKRSIPNEMPRGWKKKLLEFYDYKCINPSCEKEINEKNPLSHDHVIPLVLGGAHSLVNSQLLCFSCNASKQDKIIDYRDRKME